MSDNNKKQNNKKNNNKNTNKNNNVKKITPNNKNSNQVNNSKKKNDLEKTGKVDLVFDDERLEKTELLDISFIEEPSKEKKEEKKDDKKIEILDFEDEKLIRNINKKNPTMIILIVLVAFTLGFTVSVLFTGNKVETKVEVQKEEVIKNDENIVFLGDSLFEMYNVEEYFEGRHVVNSGISGHKTTDILKNMEKRVYQYNPSDIFLLIGTNDFLDDNISRDDTVLNIGKIVDAIKKNRPSAKINVLSLLPVNKSDDEKISYTMLSSRNNKDINEINDKLKTLCNDKNVTYVDVHSLLEDENGDLNIDYTLEGLHITPEGYKVITKELMKYIPKK